MTPDFIRICDLCDFASNSLRKPTTVTPGQVQEIAWGFLVAARQLAAKPRALS